MEIFKNLPREILSVIFVFASQMRICEYFDNLEKETKGIYCDVIDHNEICVKYRKYTRNIQWIKICNVFYFNKPQVIPVSKYSDLFLLHLKEIIDFKSINNEYMYYFYIHNKKIISIVVLYSWFSLISYGAYHYVNISEINEIVNVMQIDNIIKEIVSEKKHAWNNYCHEFVKRVITHKFDIKMVENKFTQDEHEYLRYLVRNHNRIIY
jgi:hypothetical protein